MMGRAGWRGWANKAPGKVIFEQRSVGNEEQNILQWKCSQAKDLQISEWDTASWSKVRRRYNQGRRVITLAQRLLRDYYCPKQLKLGVGRSWAAKLGQFRCVAQCQNEEAIKKEERDLRLVRKLLQSQCKMVACTAGWSDGCGKTLPCCCC